MSALLLELGTEEIPAGYIRPALRDMEAKFREALAENRLDAAVVRTTGTPRRLTLFADGLPAAQKDVETAAQGPPARVAFDEQGKATKAAIKFAQTQGVDVSALQVRQTERGSYCFAVKKEPARPAAEVLPEILTEVANAIAFPKTMRWAGSPARFARPVRNIVALLDDACLPLKLFGLAAGRQTRGHAFLSSGLVTLKRADYDDYREALRKACVLVDIDERERVIRHMLQRELQVAPCATRRHAGAPSAPPDARFTEENLLQEVVMLVEWPCVVRGSFDESFLAVPAPVIEAAMMEHQRYFPVRDAHGKLLPRFLAVADRATTESEEIAQGNERVLRARLSDARYFWEADARMKLADRVEPLAQVQFLSGLGTYRDKVHRLTKLAVWIVRQLADASAEHQRHAARAALLCKSDLLTEMVGEFPSLQGKVGQLYALREGEDHAVAQAIGEQYAPKGAADEMPASPVGRIVALTDKMDNLAGGFVLDLASTGSQDPYALRRQAQAVIRLTELMPGLRLDTLARTAIELTDRPAAATDANARLLAFLKERLYQLWVDRGVPHDIIRAATMPDWADTADLNDRLRTLQKLSAMPQWSALVEVVERTCNIARSRPMGDVAESLLAEKEERELWQLYSVHGDSVRQLIEKRDYMNACLRYAEIFAQPVHIFFEKVFVNVEDARLRDNRLHLLQKINRLFSERIADLSQIVTGVEK